jgi:hypothetical protein
MATPTDTVRRSYEALGQGDVPAFISILDAHAECTEAERFPYGGGTWVALGSERRKSLFRRRNST